MGFPAVGHGPQLRPEKTDKVFVQDQVGTAGSHATYDRIGVLMPGTYNGTKLAAELQTQLNAASLITVGGSYQYTCRMDDGRIIFQHNIPNSAGRDYLYSKEWTDEPATYL